MAKGTCSSLRSHRRVEKGGWRRRGWGTRRVARTASARPRIDKGRERRAAPCESPLPPPQSPPPPPPDPVDRSGVAVLGKSRGELAHEHHHVPHTTGLPVYLRGAVRGEESNCSASHLSTVAPSTKLLSYVAPTFASHLPCVDTSLPQPHSKTLPLFRLNSHAPSWLRHR